MEEIVKANDSDVMDTAESKLQQKIARMPKYSKREELLNVITHFIGAIMSIVSFVVMMWISIGNTIVDASNYVDIISSILFGGSLILLYSNSTMYHNEKNEVRRINRQKFDHLSINILIAGSCSAFMISGVNNVWGYALVGSIWGLSLISMVLNSIDVKKFRAVSMVIYVVTGWAPIFLVMQIINACGIGCFAMLLSGGLCYTVGLIFYGIKKEFFHFIWHIFVLLGSLLHIIGVLVYVL